MEPPSPVTEESESHLRDGRHARGIPGSGLGAHLPRPGGGRSRPAAASSPALVAAPAPSTPPSSALTGCAWCRYPGAYVQLHRAERHRFERAGAMSTVRPSDREVLREAWVRICGDLEGAGTHAIDEVPESTTRRS